VYEHVQYVTILCKSMITKLYLPIHSDYPFLLFNSKGYGPNVPSSTLQKATSSYCGFNSEKRTDLDFGHGTDTGGGRTVQLIRNVENLFGPITSFTGYYELNSSPSARIVLKVGGSPLAVNPEVWKNIYFIGDPVF